MELIGYYALVVGVVGCFSVADRFPRLRGQLLYAGVSLFVWRVVWFMSGVS